MLTKEESDAISQEIWDGLSSRHRELKEELAATDAEQPTGGYELDRSPSPEVKTAVSAERLKSLNEELLQVPDGFTVHPKLVKQLERRREAVGTEGGIDWAQAESLAYASLLTEGTPVRLTGQDVERGTFSQRHLVLHDAKTGQRVSPIQSLAGALAPMELHNSPLSEIACLGFEYGYSMEAPETLVLWEAQFGDFVNSAQVIVDQFIVSALAKWGQTTRLTLLLPHGYEGSGPEHSSARLERFLTLAAEGNIRVANLTTPAQYFHLLRRQARVAKQRPLVIMTPKSLLRLPQATSRIEHLSEARFFPVLPEPRIDEAKVERLVLCTGKVYYDLKGHATRENNERVAISRVELLYPFPQEQIMEEVDALPEPPRGRLGPGGAAQHGRPRAHVAAPAAACSRASSSSATSAGPSAPARARATRPPTRWSRTASSAPRWISRSRCRSTRPSSRASAEPRPERGVAGLTSSRRGTATGTGFRVSHREDGTQPREAPLKRRSTGRYVVATALILAIGIPSVAVGFGEGRDAKLGKRNPSSGSLSAETQIIASNGSYGTRQSNKRDGEGGGAIYGCRSSAGKEPCVRANNLKGGRAFEFVDRRQGGRA